MTVTINRDTYDATYEHDCHHAVFAFAMPYLKAYHSDLVIDVMTLNRHEVGDVFTFIVREHGTHLFLHGGSDTPEEAIKKDMDFLKDIQTKAIALVTIVKAKPEHGLFCRVTVAPVTIEGEPA